MKFFCTILLVFVTHISFAQFGESIRTGRPGQAIGAFTVGKNVIQLQQGLDFHSLIDTDFPPNTYLSHNVIRFGISETVELSALIEYQNVNSKTDSSTLTLNGLSNMHFGFRVHLNNQKGWIPTTGFQMRLKLPGISSDFGTNSVASIMVFVANWRLPKNMRFGTNWVLSYSGNDPSATGKYVLNFGFPLYKNWSGFVENYGQIRETKFQTRFDGGLAYMVNKDVQLDLSAGYGNNQNVQDYFVSTGVSYRFLNFRKGHEE